MYSKNCSWLLLKAIISTAVCHTTVGCINTFLQCIPFIVLVCLLYVTWKLLQTSIKGFPMPGEGRVTMFIALTATKAVMLLAAIFMPIVHKNSFKRAPFKKNDNKPFIFRQLLFLLKYIFMGKNNKPYATHISPFFLPQQLFNDCCIWAIIH